MFNFARCPFRSSCVLGGCLYPIDMTYYINWFSHVELSFHILSYPLHLGINWPWCLRLFKYCWIQHANNLVRIFISVSMRTLGPWQLQLSFLVSFSGFGLRVTLATKDELGSVPSSSVWKMLLCAGTFSSQIVIHSEATWAQALLCGKIFFFFLLLIRPHFLMIWKKIFRFSFHIDSALVICATLGIFPFYLSYLTCQYKVVHNSARKSSCFLHSWWCFLFFLPNLVIFPFFPCSA